jgi:hypothetical protein
LPVDPSAKEDIHSILVRMVALRHLLIAPLTD